MKSEYRKFLRDLETTKRILSEAYIFDDEEQGAPVPNYDPEEEGNYEMEGDIDDREEMMQQQDVKSNKDLDSEDISRYDERIRKIREVAIDGIQDYAEDVNDPRYQFFKKVFLECDKACQEKQNNA